MESQEYSRLCALCSVLCGVRSTWNLVFADGGEERRRSKIGATCHGQQTFGRVDTAYNDRVEADNYPQPNSNCAAGFLDTARKDLCENSIP